MALTLHWKLVEPETHNGFKHYTSDDWSVLVSVFTGKRDDRYTYTLSTDDLDKLWAMHETTRRPESLWKEIADALERLRGEEYDKRVAIKIWAV